MTKFNNNLDSMFSDDLMEFWNKHQSGRRYRDLFPAGGKKTKRATADLANYAANKATAINSRKSGNINTALMYETICDRIYAGLPEFARW